MILKPGVAEIGIIGVDPGGLANIGVVVCDYDLGAAAALAKAAVHTCLDPVLAKVIRTKPPKDPRLHRKCDQAAERRGEVSAAFIEVFRAAVKRYRTVLVGFEEFTPRLGGPAGGASFMLSTNALQALCVIGLVTGQAVACGWRYPMAIHPSETKTLVTGQAASSKAEVYAVRAAELEQVAHPKLWPHSCNEHVGDAFAVAAAVAVRARSLV